MATLPGDAPVTGMEQVIPEGPDSRAHKGGLGNVTLPVPDCVKVTVPVGDDPPETVAVHDEVEPTANDAGLQVTDVEVWATVTVTETVVVAVPPRESVTIMQ
jgi:hypothetical protein